MPDLDVNADLLVEDGPDTRQLNVADFATGATGAATQTTLAAILAAITDGDEAASLALLASIKTAVEDLAADDDGISREATAISILAAVDGLETALAALNAKDFATQATLADVLLELGQKLEPGDLAALATDAMVQAIRDRLPSALDTRGLKVSDVLTADASDETTGDGTAQTLDLGSVCDLIFVRIDGADGRALVTGTPTASHGRVCEDGIEVAFPVRSQTIKVFAPLAAEITVWGAA